MEQASIIYSLVANHATVPPLVDARMAEGNYDLFTMKVLLKVNLDFTISMTFRNYTFHYHDEDGYTFLCLSDSHYPVAAAHCFLREIKALFCQKYGSAGHEGIAFSAAEFEDVLRDRMVYYNSTDQLLTTGEEVLRGKLKDIMDEADLDIELHIKKASDLMELYDKREQERQEKAQRQKQLEVCLGVCSAVIVLIFVIVTVACGGFDYNVCS